MTDLGRFANDDSSDGVQLVFRDVESIEVGERTAGAEIIGKRTTAKRVYFTLRSDATTNEYEYWQAKGTRMSVEQSRRP